jgi:membrane protease YdiL (CAAX protease family)
MSSIRAFINKHALPTYFALTFALSWGGVLIGIGSRGIPGTREEFEGLLPYAILAMLAGPSVAGVLLTGLVYGTAGLRELIGRLIRWRVGARWYAVAFLTAPLVLTAVLLALSIFSAAFIPGVFASDSKVSRLLFGITAGLAVGFFEELGWTGFAVPRLRVGCRTLTTGLIVGVLWGAWHIIATVVFASGTYSGALSLPLFLTARSLSLLVGQLPAYRVLMVWVYDRTGSLLVAMVMHVSLTASTLILEPLAISGGALLAYDLAASVAWWVIVAAIAAGDRSWLSQQPLATRAA